METEVAVVRSGPLRPDERQTQHFLDRLLLLGGLLCASSAVVFFFAYNWDVMGRLQKIGLAQILVCVPMLALLKYPLQHRVAQSGLLASGLLLGPLLALIGQIYQTGADNFELFLLWAVMLLPWLLLARSRWLGILFMLLLNLAILLALYTFPQVSWDVRFAAMLGLNLLLWMPVARMAWVTRARFWRVTNALMVAWLLVVSTCWAVAAMWDVSMMPVLGSVVWLAALLLFATLYYWRSRQRPLLLLCILSVCVWGMALVAQLSADTYVLFLLQGIFVLAMTFAARSWLQRSWSRLAETGQQPLYLRMFFTTLAWLAAQSCFLAALAFLGSVVSMTGAELAPYVAVASIALFVGAIWLEGKGKDLFVQQLAVAAAMTGQGLLILFLLLQDWLTGGVLALLQVPLFIVLRNSFVRTLCVLVFVVAGVDALGRFAVAHDLQPALAVLQALLLLAAGCTYLADTGCAGINSWLRPLKQGLTAVLWLWLIAQQESWLVHEYGPLAAAQPLWLALVNAAFLLWMLVNHIQRTELRLFVLTLGMLVLLSGWLIPGVAILVPLLVLAWWRGWHSYWVAHLLALLAVLLLYYYNLEQTLLVKSYILMGLAVLLWLLRVWLLRLPLAARRGQTGSESCAR